MKKPLKWVMKSPFGPPIYIATDGDHTWKISPEFGGLAYIDFKEHPNEVETSDILFNVGYAQGIEEAKIAVEILRCGTNHLPDWREQLLNAGLCQTKHERRFEAGKSEEWIDTKTGRFQIKIKTSEHCNQSEWEETVSCFYRAHKERKWFNVSSIAGREFRGELVPSPLPEGLCGLKAGIAVALAIRNARLKRGGQFFRPI